MIEVGIIGEAKDIVSENNIAKTLRSGELMVYATPAMIALMEEAAYKSIQGELEEGNNIPAPSLRKENIKLEDPESFVSMLVLDMDAYAEKYGDKTVRKNITIPAWLNTYGEKNNINFSRVLQDALLKRASN